jgi:hypothetical protein
MTHDNKGRTFPTTFRVPPTTHTTIRRLIALGSNFRTPHTEKLHVVERFRMINGGNTLEANIKVEDPGAFTTSWNAIQRWRRVEQAPYTKQSVPKILSIFTSVIRNLSRKQTSRISNAAAVPQDVLTDPDGLHVVQPRQSDVPFGKSWHDSL